MISSPDDTPPVQADLLGLVVETSDIDAEIWAKTGDGDILGNLLFNVANLLNAGNPHARAEATERRIALRMRRQEVLRRETPPRVWVVMDETVLRWPVGGPEVMRAQIDHLVELNRLPQVTLQIMPFTNGPHPAMRAGSFQLFRFRARELPDVVYLNGLVGAVYLDKGDDVVVYREALDRAGAQATPTTRTEAVLDRIRKDL